MTTQHEEQNIFAIKVNAENPRIITNERMQMLVDSILRFPEMLGARGILIDENNTILGGTMRHQALQQIVNMDADAIAARGGDAAYWEQWKANAVVPCVRILGATDKQKKELIIKDNTSWGNWDVNKLMSWDKGGLKKWGLNIYIPTVPPIKTPTNDAITNTTTNANAGTMEPTPTSATTEAQAHNDSNSMVDSADDISHSEANVAKFNADDISRNEANVAKFNADLSQMDLAQEKQSVFLLRVGASLLPSMLEYIGLAGEKGKYEIVFTENGFAYGD